MGNPARQHPVVAAELNKLYANVANVARYDLGMTLAANAREELLATTRPLSLAVNNGINGVTGGATAESVEAQAEGILPSGPTRTV